MFCCESWWFLTNILGELVSNKLLVDAVIHCRGAKISCAVFFKTTSSQGKFICSHIVLEGGVCKLEQLSFQHKSPLLFFWYTQIKIVGDYISYRFLSCLTSCRGILSVLSYFSFWCYFYWCFCCTMVLCCSSAQKIGKLIFSAVSCLFRHFAWFIAFWLHCKWFSSPFHWLPVVRCSAYKSLKLHLCTSVTW